MLKYLCLEIFMLPLAGMQNIYEILDAIPVSYKKYEHPAVYTCEEADELCPDIAGAKGKNLFLRNRNGNQHYLVVTLADKRVDLKRIAELLQESNLGFASERRLKEYLGLKPGSVSPFGLINDKHHDVIVIVDKDLIKHETLSFHPNVNTATLEISKSDFEKFLDWSKNEVRYIQL